MVSLLLHIHKYGSLNTKPTRFHLLALYARLDRVKKRQVAVLRMGQKSSSLYKLSNEKTREKRRVNAIKTQHTRN